MHAHQSQPHYTPTSVGGLMDPVFLRGAVSDANGVQPVARTSLRSGLQRWHVTIRCIAAALHLR